MDLFNRLLLRHIELNTVEEFDPPSHTLLQSSIHHTTVVHDIDLYFNPLNCYSNIKSRELRRDGKIHSELRNSNGRLLPAYIEPNGCRIWYKYGDISNEDRDPNKHNRLCPASINLGGSIGWRCDGKFHNTDRDEYGHLLPAVTYVDGYMAWYVNGKRHNDSRDGKGKLLPAVIYCIGTKYYYLNGIQILP
jgi:hypothetical protein